MPRKTIGTTVIDFAPYARGLGLSSFNTFRLGQGWKKRVTVGQPVLLLDKKDMVIVGRAKVDRVYCGTLSEMATMHAAHNHQFFGDIGAAEILQAFMIRMYGPHKCTPASKVVVLYLAQ